MQLAEVIGDYNLFLDNILAEIEGEGFDMNDFVQLDHICYRTSSLENYREKQQAIEPLAQLVGEVNINGRPISTYRLHEPIRYQNWRIDALELPAPNPSKEVKEGLEHIELVLYDTIETFLKKYDGKPFNLRSVNRGVNPEIGLQLPSYGVKFHLLNLPTVVYLEQKLKLEDIHD